MRQSIVHLALVVRDYDEAIDFYTRKLGFELLEDTPQPDQDKRWVVVSPPGSTGVTVLLARASKPEQEPFVGNQAGGRVFLFLNTDDFWRDFRSMKAKGIRFVREPAEQDYGTVAVFEDLYGNLWDLLQLNEDHPMSRRSVLPDSTAVGLTERLEGGLPLTAVCTSQQQLGLLQGIVSAASRQDLGGSDPGPGGSKAPVVSFAGSNAAAKVRAAAALGHELGREVCRVDLRRVVSQYIGETEKNLRRLFDAAERSGAILFFDEADALFGKRSDVEDAHDRYANLEIGYLLGRMEAYNGLVIVSIRTKDGLSDALLRRIETTLDFGAEDIPGKPRGRRR